MADGFDTSIPDLQLGGFDMPSFNFGGGGFDFGGFSPTLDFGGFNAPSFAPTPDFGSMTQMAAPSFGQPAPAFNEALIPHNLLAPSATLPPQQPQNQGMLGGLFGHQPSGLELGLLATGLLPLLMGSAGAFQNQRPSEQRMMQPQQTTTTRPVPTAAQADIQRGQGTAEQTALLNALLGTSSPILNPALVEQAFQPQLGSLTQQAIESAQQAGFHTSPLESPVAQRIMSQGLADLQGQIAAAKLGQQQFASNLGANLFGQLQGGRLQQAGTNQLQTGGGSTVSQLGGPSPLFGSAQQLSQLLGQFGQGLAAFQPRTTNINLGGGPSSLSGAPR